MKKIVSLIIAAALAASCARVQPDCLNLQGRGEMLTVSAPGHFFLYLENGFFYYLG